MPYLDPAKKKAYWQAHFAAIIPAVHTAVSTIPCIKCQKPSNYLLRHGERITKHTLYQRIWNLNQILAYITQCQGICKQCVRKHRKTDTKAYKQALRAEAQALKASTGCHFCAEKSPIVLDFHHLYGKDFNISQAPSRPRMLAEIAKCVVLCANCHRKVHAGLLKLPS